MCGKMNGHLIFSLIALIYPLTNLYVKVHKPLLVLINRRFTDVLLISIIKYRSASSFAEFNTRQTPFFQLLAFIDNYTQAQVNFN